MGKLKYCGYSSCGNYAVQGSNYCPKHQLQSRTETMKALDNLRPSAKDRGYDYQWAEFAKKYKEDHPTCDKCGSDTMAVDHIKPLRDYPELKYVDSNLQSLCRRCHLNKTKEETRQRNKGNTNE